MPYRSRSRAWMLALVVGLGVAVAAVALTRRHDVPDSTPKPASATQPPSAQPVTPPAAGLTPDPRGSDALPTPSSAEQDERASAPSLPVHLAPQWPRARVVEREEKPVRSINDVLHLPSAVAGKADLAREQNEAVVTEQTIVESPYHDRPIATESVLARKPDGASRLLFTHAMVADRVLVRLRDDADRAQLERSAARHGARVERALRTLTGKTFTVSLQGRGVQAVRRAVAAFRHEAQTVAIAEPDQIVHAIGIPDDPDLAQCWGLNNTGQDGGTADADIDAPEAWDITTGSHDVVVAVIDTGVDYTHPDLAANMWTNTGEIAGNNADDDGNGYIDDVHGYDFANGDGDPMDDHFHGTHCAGTIAAVGDNGIGVAGVAWHAQIMALKFLTAGGSGTLTDAIEAVDYATANGAHLTSNSWGGSGFSQLLHDSIAANARPFIAAAGNSSQDNDANGHYPSSYECDNVIAVAASDRNDALSEFSCYGATSVDLAAPGTDIYSTYPTYETDAIADRGENTYYETISGTSMATPHVAGACVLLMSEFQDWNAAQLRQFLMATVDPIASLDGVVASGGRLNVHNALTALSNPLVIAGHPTITANDEFEKNDIVQPGETVSITLPVANVGTVDSTTVRVELVSSDGDIVLTDDEYEVASIDAQSVVAAAPFTITLPTDLDTPHDAAATLRIRHDGTVVAEVPIAFPVYSLRTVTGTIVNRDTAEPVPATLVRGYGEVETSCYSDGDGTYRLPVVDAGDVTIVATKREWFPASARITAQDSTVPNMVIFPVEFITYDDPLLTVNHYGHAGGAIAEHCDGQRDGVVADHMNDFSECTADSLAHFFYGDDATHSMGRYPDLQSPKWVYQVTNAGEILGYNGATSDAQPWIWTAADGGQELIDITAKLTHRGADGMLYGGKFMGGKAMNPWTRTAGGSETVYDLPSGMAYAYIRRVSRNGQRVCGRMFTTTETNRTDKSAFAGTVDGTMDALGWLPSHPEDIGGSANQDADGINDSGAVAGWVWHADYLDYTRVATVHLGDCWIDLNDILPADMPILLKAATGITNAMEISCIAQQQYRDTIWFTNEVGVKIVPKVVPDRAPVASAGRDRRVPTGSTVALHGKVGDDGAPQYLWQQVSGPSVIIADPLARITEATLETNGTYVFRFTVDDGVNDAVSDEKTVTVHGESNAAPTIAITTPEDGWTTSETTYSRAATLDVQFDAADSDGSIERVELLVDGSVLGQAAWDSTLATPAWRFEHRIQDGTYTLVGRAWDDDGSYTDSDPVEVTCYTGEKVTIEVLYPTENGVELDYNEDFILRYRLSGGNGHTMTRSLRMDGFDVNYTVSQTEKDVIYEYNWGQIGTGPHVLRITVGDRWDDANGDMHRRMVQKFVAFDIVQPAQIAAPVEIGPTMVDEEYSLPFTGVGNLDRTWHFMGGEVPPGMVFDTDSGIYTGTPATVGAYTFTIGIQNDYGSATRTYTHEVHRPHPRTIRIGNGDTAWDIDPDDGLPVQDIETHDVFEQLEQGTDHSLTPAGPQGNG